MLGCPLSQYEKQDIFILFQSILYSKLEEQQQNKQKTSRYIFSPSVLYAKPKYLDDASTKCSYKGARTGES
jgi:hypothetical protein